MGNKQGNVTSHTGGKGGMEGPLGKEGLKSLL